MDFCAGSGEDRSVTLKGLALGSKRGCERGKKTYLGMLSVTSGGVVCMPPKPF